MRFNEFNVVNNDVYRLINRTALNFVSENLLFFLEKTLAYWLFLSLYYTNTKSSNTLICKNNGTAKSLYVYTFI